MTTLHVTCHTCKGEIAFLCDDPTRPCCAGCRKSGDACTCMLSAPRLLDFLALLDASSSPILTPQEAHERAWALRQVRAYVETLVAPETVEATA